MMNFAGQLTSYIQQSGLSVRKVAGRAGIPHQTLYHWMKGSQPRQYVSLPMDLHRLGVTLHLAEDEITHLLRLAGCDIIQSGLINLQEDPVENRLRIPKGWTFGGDAPQKYAMGLDPDVEYGGLPCITIKSLPNPTDFGTLLQTVKADSYRGQRLRFSAAVRSAGVEYMAALWMRVGNVKGDILAFDNMNNRPIVGTADWTHYSVVLDVAPEADIVGFGFFLASTGQVWMSDVHLDVVGQDVPTTDMLADTFHDLPTNLDFKD